MFSKFSTVYSITDLKDTIHKPEIYDSKFHFFDDEKGIMLCVKPAKQKSVRSYIRFKILDAECSMLKDYPSPFIFLEDGDVLYGCACDADKFDILEHILNEDTVYNNRKKK